MSAQNQKMIRMKANAKKRKINDFINNNNVYYLLLNI